MLRFIIFFLLWIISCTGENSEMSPGTIIWEKIIHHGEFVEADSLYVSPDNDTISASGGGMNTIVDENGDTLFSMESGEPAAWIDVEGNINTIYEIFNPEGKNIRSFEIDINPEDYRYPRDEMPSSYKIDTFKNVGFVFGSSSGEVWQFDIERNITWYRDVAAEWGDQPPGINDDFSIVYDNIGNIIVVGSREVDDDALCDQFTLIRKYNHTGEELWTTCYEGEGAQHVRRFVEVDINNDLYLLAEDVVESETTVASQWLIRKYSKDGVELWTKSFSNKVVGPTEIYDYTIDDDGNFYFTGRITERTNDLSQDIWVSKYDRNLEIVWSASLKNEEGVNEQGSCIALCANGDIIVLGMLNVSSTGIAGPGKDTLLWLGKVKG